MKVRFRDLSIADGQRKRDLLTAVDTVLTHGQLLMGPEVDVLEGKLANYCDMPYCVGVSSGTDALYLALRSLDIGPGDEVITTPLSWIATLNAIHLCGAHPIFVDIGDDLNIDADLIESVVTPQTKAILPVHFNGRLCDMSKICDIAERHSLLVIEDAAQAFGARENGIAAGAFGDVSAFSLNPMKLLSAYGEAGAVLTGSRTIYEKLIALRYLGTVGEVCNSPSLNAKIDTIQAAMMLVSLPWLEERIIRRNEIAIQYRDKLKRVVICPDVDPAPSRKSVFFDFTIMTEERDELQALLLASGVECKIKHPILMPHQPGYSFLPETRLPRAEKYVKQILSLPIHEKLTDADIDFVSDVILSFYKK